MLIRVLFLIKNRAIQFTYLFSNNTKTENRINYSLMNSNNNNNNNMIFSCDCEV